MICQESLTNTDDLRAFVLAHTRCNFFYPCVKYGEAFNAFNGVLMGCVVFPLNILRIIFGEWSKGRERHLLEPQQLKQNL